MVAVVDEVFVGFVGDDDEVAFDGEGGDFFGFSAGEDDAGGILRGVVVDARVCGRGELIERGCDAVAARGAGGDEQRAGLTPRMRSAMGVQ